MSEICSIVIPVHGRAVLTRRCLDALLALPECADAEVVVVDDGSDDSTPEVLVGYGDAIRVVRRGQRGGFAVACNEGARASGREWIVFLNNDTLPQQGWLTALIDYAARHPAAAAVGSRLLHPEGTTQHAGIVFGQDRFPRHLYAGFPGGHPATMKSRRMQAVTAACVLVRRDAFERAKGFDEQYLNGLEDVDLCLRLGELGYEVHYCADSVVHHLEFASRTPHAPERKAGEARYLSEWGDRVVLDDVSTYLADGLLELRYEGWYPARLRVSPLLAAIENDDRELEANRLLVKRSRQAFDLLREAVRLTALLAPEDAGLLGPGSDSREADVPSATPAPILAAGERDDLSALLAEAHDELCRRDDELAMWLGDIQEQLTRHAAARTGIGASGRPSGAGRLTYKRLPARVRTSSDHACPRPARFWW